MRTIGIDCRFAALHAGLGRYTREIVRELLQRQDPVRYVLFVQSSDEAWLNDVANATAPHSLIQAPFSHYSIQEQMFFPGILRRSKIDLLFSPHFNVPLACPVPFVVTLHDLILHRYPNEAGLLKQLAYRTVMRHAVRASKSIIAVSRFTADEIGEVYGKRQLKKIFVIHEGVRTSQSTPDIRAKFDLRKPLFLYVGNAKQHKNLQMLIDAFAGANIDKKELVLVTDGREVRRLRLVPGVRILSSLSENDVWALYREAAAFVTASLYEGFCLPVAEALSAGCPVIASHYGAIPEVAQGHAVLIEPTAAGFGEAMAREMPSRGSPLPSLYSWRSAAEETARVLLDV